jgi:hypothetical protein
MKDWANEVEIGRFAGSHLYVGISIYLAMDYGMRIHAPNPLYNRGGPKSCRDNAF